MYFTKCGPQLGYNYGIFTIYATCLTPNQYYTTDVQKGDKTICSSTEKLLPAVKEVNKERVRENDIDLKITKFAGINHKELKRYLSLLKTDEILRNTGLHDVYPKRRHRRGGTQENEEDQHAQWIFRDKRIIETTKQKRSV